MALDLRQCLAAQALGSIACDGKPDKVELEMGDEELDRYRDIVPDGPDVQVPGLAWRDEQLLNRQSGFNRVLLEESGQYGCFHCGRKFPVSLISEWMEEPGEEDTGVCPYCGVDALVVGTSEHPLSTALLTLLYEKWFKAERDERESSANFAPGFASQDDYLRKGIPFRWEYRPEASRPVFDQPDADDGDHAELGDMPVWSVSDPGEFRFDGEGAEMPGVDTDVPLGGVWKVHVWKGEPDRALSDEELNALSEDEYLEYLVSDAEHYELVRDGATVCLTPWGGSDQARLESLAREYGDRLMAVFKSGDFGNIQLFVMDDENNK